MPNPNAKTAQLVPGLIHVADGYTKDELKTRILKGQREIPALDAKRPPPPLYMPAWGGTIKDAEVDDLIAYLISLKPKGEDRADAPAVVSRRGVFRSHSGWFDKQVLRALHVRRRIGLPISPNPASLRC